MRSIAAAVLACGLIVWTSAFAASPVRISQVYAGGGLNYAAYNHDYIELFNSSDAPVSISEWTIYSATRYGAFYNRGIMPVGATIPACGYFLIRCDQGGAVGADLPAHDGTFSAAWLDQADGKVALLSIRTSIYWDCQSKPASLVDLVGYTSGASLSCFEGSPGPYAVADSGQTVTARKLGGMTDTDNNAADFEILTSWTAHNSTSAMNPECAVVPTVPGTWGRVKVIYR